MKLNRKQLVEFIIPQFKWWKPCWYALLADILLMIVSCCIYYFVNVNKMQEKSGILAWVKHDVSCYDKTSKYYEYEFKLQNDPNIYKQAFELDNPFRSIVFNFGSLKDNPYCKRNDHVAFYVDNSSDKVKESLVAQPSKQGAFTRCYGLKVNGKTAISAMWIFTKTTLFSILFLIALLLAIPVTVMLVLGFGSNRHKRLANGNDALIEKADACWVGKKRRNYKKAAALYAQVLEKSPEDYRALSMYAQMLVEQKRYDEADLQYEKMNKIAPGTAAEIYEIYSEINGCEARAAYWKTKITQEKPRKKAKFKVDYMDFVKIAVWLLLLYFLRLTFDNGVIYNGGGIEKRGTLAWVKADTIRLDVKGTMYRYDYAFKLRGDTTVYQQTFDAGNVLRFFIFNFNSKANNPYCKPGDMVSFYLKDYEYSLDKPHKKCKGLAVNGKTVIWRPRHPLVIDLFVAAFLLISLALFMKNVFDFYVARKQS